MLCPIPKSKNRSSHKKAVCFQILFTRMCSILPSGPNLRVLKRIYKRSLQLLRKFPKDAVYRVNTETILCYRMSVVEECGDDIKQIEECLKCGKMESILEQAENEYNLIQKMFVYKPWESLVERPPLGQWDWPPYQTN